MRVGKNGVHIVMSINLDDGWKNPQVLIHATFTVRRAADAYVDKLNEDVIETEQRAIVRTLYPSELTAKAIRDNNVYRVTVTQTSAATFGAHKVETWPPITSLEVFKYEDHKFNEKWQDVVWIGWEKSPLAAVKRAKQQAMSAWRGR